MHDALRFIVRTQERRYDDVDRDATLDVLVWDIDKTYLETRFSSLRGLLSIPLEGALDKHAVAGAVPLLRGLRTGPDDEHPRLTPLYFVSGSPPGLRRVLERKMTLDGVQFDGLCFKDQAALLRAGRPRAILEQVGYKLCALLLLRRELPASVRLYLFGDDVEKDPDVFVLFGAVLSGLRGPALRERLRDHGVAWPEIEAAVQLSSDLPTQDDPVQRVFVRSVRGRLLGEGAPADPRVVVVRSHLQSAIVLHGLRMVSDRALVDVVREVRARVGADDALELIDDAAVRLQAPRESVVVAQRAATSP